MLSYYTRMFYRNPFRRGFWWGVGTAGAFWLFGKNLRPLAVEGAKGLIKLDRGVKGTVRQTSEGVGGIVMEAQANRLKDKVKSMNLSDQQRKLIKKDIGKLSMQLDALNEAVDPAEREH
ncbi:MAG: hypothetical protein SCK29_05220 [Bacillota bacterium]|nr:hypothetical protein [Bacillota bacterium]MDW7683503.1 hypothetical protein [Bacillota bacterium]